MYSLTNFSIFFRFNTYQQLPRTIISPVKLFFRNSVPSFDRKEETFCFFIHKMSVAYLHNPSCCNGVFIKYIRQKQRSDLVSYSRLTYLRDKCRSSLQICIKLVMNFYSIHSKDLIIGWIFHPILENSWKLRKCTIHAVDLHKNLLTVPLVSAGHFDMDIWPMLNIFLQYWIKENKTEHVLDLCSPLVLSGWLWRNP